MANDFNSCTFTGRLGRDCESKFMSSGDAVANFSIAVGEKWISKTGETQERTTWINVVAYKKLAEICMDYLKKGAHVLVSGKLQIREYDAKDGTKKQSTELILDKMQMLGGKREEAHSPAQHQAAPTPARSPSAPPDFDDDIPF